MEAELGCGDEVITILVLIFTNGNSTGCPWLEPSRVRGEFFRVIEQEG